jgi:hypothetical protein
MHVMPWAGLMRDGVVDEPLRIIDRCRISWATVVGPADGVASGTTDSVLVRRLPLVWSGSRLVWGEPVVETMQTSIIVQPGDAVAVHWDWICERLDVDQLAWLRRVTNRQLADVHAG